MYHFDLISRKWVLNTFTELVTDYVNVLFFLYTGTFRFTNFSALHNSMRLHSCFYIVLLYFFLFFGRNVQKYSKITFDFNQVLSHDFYFYWKKTRWLLMMLIICDFLENVPFTFMCFTHDPWYGWFLLIYDDHIEYYFVESQINRKKYWKLLGGFDFTVYSLCYF